jgi:raffinose synthase
MLQYTGVVGLFNCQGGGWCPKSRRNKSASECSHSLTCSASPKDIEWNNGKHPIPTKGVNMFAIYMFKEKRLKLLKSSEGMEISLEQFSYELLTVSPVTTLSNKLVQVAPIGLVKMLNSGGAIQSLEFDDDENLVRIGVKGSGEMRVFASEKPMSCKIDGVGVDFSYIGQMIVVQVPWPNSSSFSLVQCSF